MNSKKSTIFFVSMISCLCASACDELSRDTSAPELAQTLETTQSPILNGSVDEDDLAVVGLFEVTEKLENGNYRGSIYCTGTIIHPNWVLTAAHCVTETDGSIVTPSSKNNRMMIYVGTNRKKGGHVYEIAGANKIYWHYQYINANESGNDIA
ncbi:MAG: trypsin-like serine protease, partial [Proteobacteria bacterium]|nr:trypsin-like serine protease [Pseudomonadota bacterium]